MNKEELNELKQEYKALTAKLKELNEEELKLVFGGSSAGGAAGAKGGNGGLQQ